MFEGFFYIPQMTEAFGALYNCPAVREVIAIKRLMPRVSSRSLMHTQDEVRAVLTAAFALITERIAAFQPGLSSLNLDMIEPFFTHFLFLGGADDTLPR